MFGLLKGNPLKKLEKEYDALLEKAMQTQRNGDIKNYSLLMESAEKVKAKIDELKENSKDS